MIAIMNGSDHYRALPDSFVLRFCVYLALCFNPRNGVQGSSRWSNKTGTLFAAFVAR